jgi:hypothetical protein
MDPDKREALIYDASMRQLERMRAMQYAYHNKFFFWITLNFVLLVWLYAGTGGRGLLVIPFLVVTAGVQAAFYLHFCDFARLHAAALEKKINELLQRRVLMGAELEGMYFYPLPEPKVAGFIPSAPLNFFSGYTLHWCLLWVGLFLISVWQGYASMASPLMLVWVLAAVGWAVLNFGYVAWYFLRSGATDDVAERLEEKLHGPLE